MGEKKTISAIAAVLCAGMFGPPAAASTMETFAACTGRLSAELEHAWLMGEEGEASLAAQRSAFIEILSAITPPDESRRALSVRIDAKQAHAVILTRATFADDPSQIQWATAQARLHLRACTDLLLSS